MKLVKCFSISLLIVSIVLGLGCNAVKEESAQSSSHDMSEIDEFLIETGMPLDTVKALDEELKTYIYETIDTTEKQIFSGHSGGTIAFPDTDDGNISSNTTPHLSLTVTAFEDSNEIYQVYPTFEWKVPNKVAIDTFAFALPEGWEFIPSKYNLRLWHKTRPGDAWKMVDDLSRPSTIFGYGFAWKIPKNYYTNDEKRTIKYYIRNAYIKGHAYFCVESVSPTPDKRICVSYADDTSIRLDSSYSFIYEALSISLTSDSDDTVRFIYELLEF